jgi:hypothetical protein
MRRRAAELYSHQLSGHQNQRRGSSFRAGVDFNSGLRGSFAKRDYQTFLDVRTRLIAKTFEVHAGAALFRRD